MQQRASSFDEFVGELLEMQRHIETERLGGLEVDHQFVLDGDTGCPVPLRFGVMPMRWGRLPRFACVVCG